MNTLHKKLIQKSGLIFILSAMISCQKVEFDKTNLDKPVVDGIVYANQSPVIHLSSPIGYGIDGAIQADINNAKVTIDIDGKTFDLPSIGLGDYTNPKVIIRAGQVLNLKVLYNGYTSIANTTVPQKPKSFAVSSNNMQIIQQQGGPGGGQQGGVQVVATWLNDTQEYYALMAKSVDTNPEQIPGRGDRGGQQQQFTPRLENIQGPTQSNTTNVGRQNFQFYGKYKLILFKVNSEYTDLYNNRGQSSLNLTNPPTNVTDGFGVFTAMNADTLAFEVLK